MPTNAAASKGFYWLPCTPSLLAEHSEQWTLNTENRHLMAMRSALSESEESLQFQGHGISLCAALLSNPISCIVFVRSSKHNYVSCHEWVGFLESTDMIVGESDNQSQTENLLRIPMAWKIVRIILWLQLHLYFCFSLTRGGVVIDCMCYFALHYKIGKMKNYHIPWFQSWNFFVATYLMPTTRTLRSLWFSTALYYITKKKS